jgi:hypothetical protein
MEQPDVDLDYAYYEAMDEFLRTAIGELDAARYEGDDVKFAFHLKQGSRALRTAMETFRDRRMAKKGE